MSYHIEYEQTDTGFSAYVPDLPGCVAVGTNREEVEKLILEAIPFHLEGLRLHSGYNVAVNTITWRSGVNAGYQTDPTNNIPLYAAGFQRMAVR